MQGGTNAESTAARSASSVSSTRIALIVLAAGAAFLAAAGTAAALDVNADITQTTRWTLADSPVKVHGQYVVRNGATLTIDPGVEVRFDANARLQIGDRFQSGTLNALGTAAQPITFKSASGAKDWPGLYFYGPATTARATLSNVTVRDVNGVGVHLREWRDALFTDLTVQDTNGDGVYVDVSTVVWRAGSVLRTGGDGVELASSTLTARDVLIDDAAKYGVRLDSASRAPLTRVTIRDSIERPYRGNVADSLATLSMTGNRIQEIELWGNTLTANTRLAVVRDSATAEEIPIVMLSGTTVRGGATLTVDPGVTVRNRGGSWQFGFVSCGWGCSYENGALIALGTAADPIVFTSDDGGLSWGGLYFAQPATGANPSNVANFTVERVSGNAIRIDAGASLRMRDSVVRDVTSHGASVSGTFNAARSRFSGATTGFGVVGDTGAAVTVTDSTFAGNRWTLRTRLGYGISGNTFDGNTENEIQLYGNTLYGSYTLPVYQDATSGEKIAIHMLSGTLIREGARLTILPGTRIELDANVGFQFGEYRCGWGCTIGPLEGGYLTAVGTAAAPITFTSASGGRSWGALFFDGRGMGASPQQAHQLSWVVVEKSATSAIQNYVATSFTISNATIRDNAGHGAYFESMNGAVVDSTFADNAAAGLALANADTTVLRNTFQRNGFGVSQDSNADPNLRQNVFDSNVRPLRTKLSTSFRDNTFTASTVKEIELWGFTLTTTMTWSPLLETGGAGHSWALLGNAQVQNSARVTLPPGFAMDLRGYELRFGTNSWQGNCAVYCATMDAAGTEAAPIVFANGRILLDNYHNANFPQILKNVTFRNAPDIALYTHYLGALRFENLVFDNAGRAVYQYASTGTTYDNLRVLRSRSHGFELQAGGSAVITDSRFENTVGHGVYSCGVTANVIGNTFVSTTGYAVYLTCGATGDVRDNVIDGTSGRPLRAPLYAGLYTNTVTNAGVKEIEIATSTLTTDLTLREVPFNDGNAYTYRFAGNVLVRNRATLTIEPGQTLLFEPGVELRAGDNAANGAGAIVARGTTSEPITFSSLSTWSGIHLDGSAANELPSAFDFVTVERVNTGYGGFRVQSLDALTIEHADIRDNYGSHGVWASASSFTIRDSVLQDNPGSGVALAGSSNPTIERNLFRANGYGLTTASTDTPRVVGNTFNGSLTRHLAVSVRTDVSQNTFESTTLREIIVSGGDVYDARRLKVIATTDTNERMTYVVTENVRVFGAGVLTLDPGVTLRFTQSRNLQVGACCTAAGSLVARGTAAEPITFTSYRGLWEWNGLHFDGRWGGGATISRLENVTIERTDSQSIRAYSHSGLRLTDSMIRENSGTGVYLESASPQFVRVGIASSNGHGIDARSGAPVLRQVTVTGSNGFGILTDQNTVLDIRDSTIARSADRPLRIAARAILGADVVLDSNRYPEIELLGTDQNANAPVTADRTIPKLVDATTGETAPYVVRQRIDVIGATLTIAPGVTLRFMENWYESWGTRYYNDGMQIGNGATSGALVARGTADEPITLTSDTNGRTWPGLRLDGRGTARASALEHVIVEKSRADGVYAYRVPTLTIADSTLRNNAGAGANVQESPATITRTLATDNVGSGILVQTTSARLLGNTLRTNGAGGIALTSATTVTPEVSGNLFSGNAQAGLLASNAVRPTIADNRFEGAGRAIGVSNLAQPLDVRSGDAGDAGILDGLFRPLNGGTNWFYVTPVKVGARQSQILYEGPAGSSMDTTLRDRFPGAGFKVSVFAVNDGRLVQTIIGPANGAGELPFNLLIDGARRAVVDVIPEVAMDFSWSPALPTVETPVTFTDLSAVRYADVVALNWNFGDTVTCLGLECTHQYGQKRIFLVTLTITLDTGATFTREEALEVVNAKPHAEWSHDVVRPAEVEALLESRATVLDEIQFTDESYDVDGFIVEQFTVWDFGDGVLSDDPDPIHTFENPGDYNVCITVADDDLAPDTLCRTIHVWAFDELAVVEATERAAAAEARIVALQSEAQETGNATAAQANATVAEAQIIVLNAPAVLEARLAETQATLLAAAGDAQRTAEAAAADAQDFAARQRACVEAIAAAPAPSATMLADCATAAITEISARIDGALAAPLPNPEVLP